MVSHSPQAPSSLKKDQQLKILIIDDEKLVSQVLNSALEAEPDLEVVGSIEESDTALQQVGMISPDIILMDIEMPGIDGFTLTSLIVKKYPQIKVVIYSCHEKPEYVYQSMVAGAKGFILKNTPIAEIAEAIRFVNKGYIHFRTGLFEAQSEPVPALQSGASISNTAKNSSTTELSVPITADSVSSNVAVAQTKDAPLETSDADVDDWSPATQDLLDALPKVWTRGLAYMLITFAAIALPAASLSRIDETGSARGRLEPKGKTIKLDAAVAGRVAKVMVEEGERVAKGEVLVELDAELLKNQLGEFKSKRSGQENRLEQLELIQNQLEMSLTTHKQQNQAQQLEKQSQVDQARQSLESLRAVRDLQTSEIAAKVEQAKQAIETSKADYQLANIARNGTSEKVSRYQEAFDDGIIPLDRLRDIEQQEQENQKRLQQTQSQVKLAKSQLQEQQRSYERIVRSQEFEIDKAKLYLQEQQRSYQTLVHTGELALLKTQEQVKDIATQITALQTDIAQNNSQIAALQLQLRQRVLKAPVAGRVFHLSVAGAGDVLQPGEQMVEIAPDSTPLVLRAQISPKESGALKLGMPVKMKFDAYPFQDYGTVTGHLSWISPDSKHQQIDQSLQEVFELEVELDKTYVEDQNKRLLLTPGQTATAEVIIKQRRAIELALEPFKKLRNSGLEI